MLFRNTIVAIAMIASAGYGYAQSAASSAVEFVAVAASSNRFEIQSSQLALEASKNPDVKSLAQKLITDHRTANKALKAAAAAEKVPFTKKMAERDEAALSVLKGKTGEELDRLYLDAQLKAHDDAVALFSSFAQKGDKPRLKAYASDSVGTLKAHQEQVKRLISGKSS